MSDAASLFSDTATLYDVPTLFSDSSGGLMPIEECFVVLLINHEYFKIDTDQFNRAGLPSVYDRSNHPSGSRSALAKLNLKKQRCQVQFPKVSLQHAIVDRKKPATTVDDVRKIREGKVSTTGKMRTMFDSLEDDLVGVRFRRLLDEALAILFRAIGVHSPTLFYPAQHVLVTPRWAASKDGSTITAAAQWATLSFVSPTKEISNETKKEAEERYFATLRNKETDEETLERLFIPDQRSDQMLDDLLSHLESRGAIWHRAGHATRPSIKNRSPRDRPEFVVLGLFPLPFVNRCKVYHRKGEPLPNDLTEAAKSKLAPLVVAPCNEPPAYHKNGGAHEASEGGSAADDFLCGWTVRIATDEPYRNGSIWQDGTGVIMAGGGMAAFSC